jgi:hypothetical protein
MRNPPGRGRRQARESSRKEGEERGSEAAIEQRLKEKLLDRAPLAELSPPERDDDSGESGQRDRNLSDRFEGSQ